MSYAPDVGRLAGSRQVGLVAVLVLCLAAPGSVVASGLLKAEPAASRPLDFAVPTVDLWDIWMDNHDPGLAYGYTAYASCMKAVS